jgi:hypothetical protein
MNKIVNFLFGKTINKLAEDRLETIALDKYINENLFIDTTNGLELQFRGKKFIQHMTAAVYELVKDAPNYVEISMYSAGYEPMIVTIQKRGKLSPNDKVKNLEKEVEELKKKIPLDNPFEFT